MFWNTKSDPNPLGVPLGDLQAILAPTSIKATVKGNILTARHEHYIVRVEVVPPEHRDSQNGPIRAVVRMITELPEPIMNMFRGKEVETTTTLNPFAALGSLYIDRGHVYIGSRLTIYEAEDAWEKLQLPVLMFATVCGGEAILGALRRLMTREGQKGGRSEWTEHDFSQVDGYLSRMCLCNFDASGLTAEFGLTEGAISAVAGDHETALFQFVTDQPHPELGGGLFCLLQMPHQVRDTERLNQVCMQLNNLEMAARDLPPHFGAWCPGKMEANPAYISFLPNAMRMVPGIAANFASWAFSRSRWANATLASMGVGSQKIGLK